MPGDYTRVTFNPFEDHLGVLMQQGRVLLDADFNELVEILGRRLHAGTMDIIGRCAVPRETPDGFRIQISGTTITIGRGRIYVDGLLAENHGKAPLEFDPSLGELRGTLPVPYNEQPYLPNAGTVLPFPDKGGPYLVYVDVWQREITHLEEPDLIEKAVGVDTATRLQTVWQVRWLQVGRTVTCATPSDQIPPWVEATRPSAGRLTTAAVGAPKSTDPCIVNPTGGFRGTENRLYRLEVHDTGPLGSATFKWSRDNGSVATSVLGINAGRDELTVTRTARDAVLRFSPDDWVEVTDDWHELAGTPGVMRKVKIVDDVTSRITLASALPAGDFDTANPQSRHTRIRRWDQKGLVRDAANAVLADVDAGGGVIPVLAAGSPVLEDGVQVTFGDTPDGGDFHTGDFWVFAARTVDASVEELTDAPPRGIHHHYCRLAVVTFPGDVLDCRPLWPPEFGEKGCDCTECVSAEEHNSGKLTVQTAIDRVKSTGGKVCLGPGLFFLREPVRLEGAQSVQVQGHGWHTVLFYPGQGAAMVVDGCIGIDLSAFWVIAASQETSTQALLLQNSAFVRVERCFFFGLGEEEDLGASAVGLGGFLLETVLRDNVLLGKTGLLSLAQAPDAPGTTAVPPLVITALFGLRVEDNVIVGGNFGIRLEGFTLHLGETRLAGNSVASCRLASIVARGFVFPRLLGSSHVDIMDNSIQLLGDGIVVGVDDARINNNDIGIFQIDSETSFATNGISLVAGLDREVIDRCQVIGNRITQVGGHGISVQTGIGSAMIKQNVIDGARGGGIVMEDGSTARHLTIENNQVLNGNQSDESRLDVAAIRVTQALDVAVTGNAIADFAAEASPDSNCAAIRVIASTSVRIQSNELLNIGRLDRFFANGMGIDVIGPFARVDVLDNTVRRNVDIPEPAGESPWIALRIQSRVAGRERTTFSAGTLLMARLDEPNRFVILDPFRAHTISIDREVVAVRGNLLETYGGVNARAVQVAINGHCMINDNRCLSTSEASGQPIVAEVFCRSAIANANYLQRFPPNDVTIALDLHVNHPSGIAFTVLGNLCGGQIHLNGNPLPDPWGPLNSVEF